MVAEPPVVPLTVQVTLPSELPLTVAVNWNESPARTLAVAGVSVTVVVPGVEGADGADGLLFEVVVPPQPQASRAARSGSDLIVVRMVKAHP